MVHNGGVPLAIPMRPDETNACDNSAARSGASAEARLLADAQRNPCEDASSRAYAHVGVHLPQGGHTR